MKFDSREFQNDINNITRDIMEKARDVAFNEITDEVLRRNKEATGDFINSLTLGLTTDSSTDEVSYEMLFSSSLDDAVYNAIINQTKPAGGGGSDKVAFNNIKRWAIAKSINPEHIYPIYRQIMREGTLSSRWGYIGGKYEDFGNKLDAEFADIIDRRYEEAVEDIERSVDDYIDNILGDI